jgi:hypothetical protein
MVQQDMPKHYRRINLLMVAVQDVSEISALGRQPPTDSSIIRLMYLGLSCAHERNDGMVDESIALLEETCTSVRRMGLQILRSRCCLGHGELLAESGGS